MCSDDYCFEVEKEINRKFTKMIENAAIDRIPVYDSAGNPWDEMYDTLNVEDKFLQEFNVNGYYSFNKGKYRVRFSFQLPTKNNSRFKQIFSDWLYFEVKPKYLNFYL